MLIRSNHLITIHVHHMVGINIVSKTKIFIKNNSMYNISIQTFVTQD